ncbi:hypothetical protein AKJ16_DCAP26386 [Drosera capensis]
MKEATKNIDVVIQESTVDRKRDGTTRFNSRLEVDDLSEKLLCNHNVMCKSMKVQRRIDFFEDCCILVDYVTMADVSQILRR